MSSTLKPFKDLVLINALPPSRSFDINLQSANWLEIPLHISVRPDEKCIIRNSRTAKSLFGEEERCGGMPLTMGKDFKVTIEADECGFHLWIDGQQFAVMKHRMEMQKIECLCINGKVEITSIRMRNACMKSVPKEDAA